MTGRTFELAEMIAAGFGKDAEVVQAIKWDAVRQKAHKMKEYRTPELYLPHMRIGTRAKVSGPYI